MLTRSNNQTRTKTGIFSLFLYLFASAVLLSPVHADELETLLMPGKVIQGHAKYETQCRKCHQPFRNVDTTPKCRACHKKINKDIKQNQGFHGKSRLIKNQPCTSCHTEHIGRKADIVKFDKATFDHQYTNFSLKGAHIAVPCASCHKKNQPWRKAPTKCRACHKKDSPHQPDKRNKKTMLKCASCHQSRNWQRIRYNHNKTHFRLRGKHVKIGCTSCHTNDRYVKTPRKCVSCHRVNDIHRGSNGTNCKKCHSTRGWKKLGFDHNKDTKFPLRYTHKKVTCKQCHKGDPKREKTRKKCISCHKKDDSHQGRFGKKCKTCHSEKGWQKARFNHNKTDYPLKGKHKKATCKACHRKHVYKNKTPSNCYSCHKLDDVHKGQQGKRCETCHDENGWRKRVRFDHDLTRFPLIGLHAVTPCEECHLNNQYKSAKIACFSCHQEDDIHKRKLGENCQKCHNPNGWRLWRFDHNKTRFKIDGKHKKVYCDDCHTRPIDFIDAAPRTCIECHRADDVHDRQFGKRCERCHTTNSFSDLELTR